MGLDVNTDFISKLFFFFPPLSSFHLLKFSKDAVARLLSSSTAGLVPEVPIISKRIKMAGAQCGG